MTVGQAASATSGDELRVHLEHVLHCLLRHIARHYHRLLQADGKLSDLFVSVGEARATLGLAQAGAVTPIGSGTWPSVEEASRLAASSARRLESLPAGPFAELAAIFGLDRRQLRLLAAAAAPLLSVDVARLFTFAWADFAAKQPGVGFLAELVADAPEEVALLVAELGADAPLVRHRLLRTSDLSTWSPPTPLLHRVVSVPDRVVAWLVGQRSGLPTGCEDVARLDVPAQRVPAGELCAGPKVLSSIGASLDEALADPRHQPRLLLVGAAGAGRRTLLHAVAADRGWGVLTCDLHRLAQGPPERFEESLREVAREALLGRSVLLVRGDALFEDLERLARVERTIGRVLDGHPGPLAIASHRVYPWIQRALGRVRETVLTAPTTEQQQELWRRSVLAGGGRSDAGLPRLLVDRFNLPPGTIRAAVDEALARLRSSGEGAEPLGLERIAEAVRRRADHALSQIADPFTTTLTWDDVVFPDELMNKFFEIITHARHRDFVFRTWGFRRMMSYGRGLSCLFSGGPGTGKTMVAAIMAQTLGRELYRIDLSRVASKWIGETEKNLARVFDEAEKAQVILLFDEADSLFSTRTEIKSSNDRFANMEVNYLLQRMEAYDGMTILTTNFEKSLDEAFKRRIKFRLHFPTPDPAHRAELWRVMIPAEAKAAPDIRFDLLGKRFEISGGNIKNAVLRAAFAAVEQGGAIDFDHLERAAIVECEEMGRLIGT